MPPAALAAAVIGGGVLSAGTQVMSGVAGQQASNAQAAAFARQAGLERESAGMQIAAQDYEANKLMATARANAAAAGVAPGTGSAKVVNMMNASEAMLRDTAARYSGNLRASSDLAEAANARMVGRQQLIGGIASGVGSLLTAGVKTFAPTGAGGLGIGGFGQ